MLNGCRNYPFPCECQACWAAHNDKETRLKLGVFNINVVFNSKSHPNLDNSLIINAPAGIYYIIVYDILAKHNDGILRISVKHNLINKMQITRSNPQRCFGDIMEVKRRACHSAVKLEHYGGNLSIYNAGDLAAELQLQIVKQNNLEPHSEVFRFSKREIFDNIISRDDIDQFSTWLLCRLWNHNKLKGQNYYLKVPLIDGGIILDEMNIFKDINQDSYIAQVPVKRLMKINEVE